MGAPQGFGAVRAGSCRRFFIGAPLRHIEGASHEAQLAQQGQRLHGISKAPGLGAAGLGEHGFAAFERVDLHDEGATFGLERDARNASRVRGGPQLFKGQCVHGHLCKLGSIVAIAH